MEKGLIGKKNSKSSKISIFLSFFACLSFAFLISTITLATLYMNEKNSNLEKNLDIRKLQEPTEERYIPVLSKVTEEGGAYAQRGKYDIKNSKYFKYIDIFNMKSEGSLILLEKFKTYQQTSSYSCGLASLIMAAYYVSGEVFNETELVEKAEADPETGTNINKLIDLVQKLGYECEHKKSFTEEECPSRSEEAFSKYIQETLKKNQPIIVISNDWGGHYSVIIGYDDMGTKDYIEDDVIIIADPYDTTDHMNDGYTIFSYSRFYAQMQIKVFGVEDQDLNFITIKKKNSK
jgi:hypothetical protein